MKEEMRKIVQVAADRNDFIALCNDGTTWYLNMGMWKRLKDSPQPWEEKEVDS